MVALILPIASVFNSNTKEVKVKHTLGQVGVNTASADVGGGGGGGGGFGDGDGDCDEGGGGDSC